MTSSSILSLVAAQTWQVAVLASGVWLITRFATRNQSHFSHMLWTLVLLKCITPPIWSSHVGLFSQLSSQLYSNGAFEDRKESMSAKVTRSELNASTIHYGSSPLSSTHRTASDVDRSPKSPASTPSFCAAFLALWIVGALICAVISMFRYVLFLRVIHSTTCATPSEISNCVERLNSQLGVRQRVGVKVISSSFGPSVYGLLRPIIILPQAIVAGRTEQQLEPLIAHEMIHIRRSDLLLAIIQSIACCLGWFHPMVWLASRRVTIESERCCDEETIASLRCKPATYARSLLDVLERKHLLRVAQALPGMRPVDITSARLERIMRLGQGSRSRGPWWLWCVGLLVGIAILPGAKCLKADPFEVTQARANKDTREIETHANGARGDRLNHFQPPHPSSSHVALKWEGGGVRVAHAHSH